MYVTSGGGTSSAVEIKENLFMVEWEMYSFPILINTTKTRRRDYSFTGK